ncbi:hypothetical protein CNMCM6069_000272 [Aspergillus lentulus]|uniref:MACPF domain-containing protein n=1 Tax=Aspergillus lentulus TaxID=293939 RepID=A0ABQ1AKL7_ASPLE|nr:hypothetical protein CNMCM6069_000272 [Aspergillus lentulus]KAF4170427.1 hypothetical protein CNMCM8060_005437 [Aspergillus lentulus]KAF4192601.1 hypothetical protein CNMCM8694_000136 [Aspergillus lentulus]GFF76038.1 hypothetical protein IFM62136_09219 [Aspergillus lentulus]GFF83515.1 hypothetical protein IFM60648_06719 [Aspergillus lentulus]
MNDSISHQLAARAEGFGLRDPSSYRDAAAHTAVPATEEEWTALLKNNTSCLKGIVISRQGAVPEMAQYTAFEFDYDPKEGPQHVQDEKTEIQTIRIENESESQGIHIGISQQELEVFMKTIAADSRLDFRARHASFNQLEQSSKTQKIEISHRHPKFILFLDQRSLAITEDCKARLTYLKGCDDKRQAIAFLEDYGEGFAMQATIGGRLFHSENVSMLKANALEQRENSLKIAAKASLSSKDPLSKGVSTTSGTQTLHTDNSKISSVSEGMFWCGIGGDPGLHGEPRAWMLSMKEDKSRWKVIERRHIVSLPIALGRFSGFEWVPEKFRKLLRPVVPSVPRLVLPDDSHIGLSSFAITSRLTIHGEKDWRVVAFQDEAGCIKYGFINTSEDRPIIDVLFVDTIARARLNTPLLISRRTYIADLAIYVTEDGFLADKFLEGRTGAWDYGSLIDHQVQVASHSNLASSADGLTVCFEDSKGNLCLVNPDKGTECLNHGRDLNSYQEQL